MVSKGSVSISLLSMSASGEGGVAVLARFGGGLPTAKLMIELGEVLVADGDECVAVSGDALVVIGETLKSSGDFERDSLR